MYANKVTVFLFFGFVFCISHRNVMTEKPPGCPQTSVFKDEK